MNNGTRIFTVCAAALVAGGWAIGCGSNPLVGNDGAGISGSGGGGGSSGSGGGPGGTGGSADAASNTPTVDAGRPGSIVCGTAICQPLMIPMIGNAVAPCCPPGEVNTCGATAFGGCLTTSMGTQSPSCPSQALGGFPLPGCCAATGVCGTNLSAIGLGCNALANPDGGSPVPCR